MPTEDEEARSRARTDEALRGLRTRYEIWSKPIVEAVVTDEQVCEQVCEKVEEKVPFDALDPQSPLHELPFGSASDGSSKSK